MKDSADQSYMFAQPENSLARWLVGRVARHQLEVQLDRRVDTLGMCLSKSLRDYQRFGLRLLVLALDEALSNEEGPADRRTDLMGLWPEGYTSRHFLLHMGTGSGKTLMMAAAIADAATRGYRRVIVLGHKTDLIAKNRNSLLPALGNPKVEFSRDLSVLGRGVRVVETDGRFSPYPGTDVEVAFFSIQELHSLITQGRANALTLDELSRQKCLILADEAHHFNVDTKRHATAKVAETGAALDEANWETTIARILSAHPENLLLEVTATIGLDQPAIFRKYGGKLVFDFPLEAMRSAGYSKRVTQSVDRSSVVERVTAACLVSQFRADVASAYGIPLIPRVLVKGDGKTVDLDALNVDSLAHLSHLSVTEARRLLMDKTTPLAPGGTSVSSDISVVDRILNKDREDQDYLFRLISRTQARYGADNRLVYHSNLPAKVRDAAQDLLVNLDMDPDRRVVFGVTAIVEGLDILAIFDIVKADTSHKDLSDTSTSVIQLIGRGARPAPFLAPDIDPDASRVGRRKFDEFLDDPRAVLEQMTFHAANENKYIARLGEELLNAGLVEMERGKVRVRAQSLPAWLSGAAAWGNVKGERAQDRPSLARKKMKGRALQPDKSASSRQWIYHVDADFVSANRGRFERALRRWGEDFSPLRWPLSGYEQEPLDLLVSLDSGKYSLVLPSSWDELARTDRLAEAQQNAIDAVIEAFRADLSDFRRQFYAKQHLDLPVYLSDYAADPGNGRDWFRNYLVSDGRSWPTARNEGWSDVLHYPDITTDSDLECSFARLTAGLIKGSAAQIGVSPKDLGWIVRNPGLLRLHGVNGLGVDGAEFRPDFLVFVNLDAAGTVGRALKVPESDGLNGLILGCGKSRVYTPDEKDRTRPPVESDDVATGVGRVEDVEAPPVRHIAVFYAEPKDESRGDGTQEAWKGRLLNTLFSSKSDPEGEVGNRYLFDPYHRIHYTLVGLPFFGKSHQADGVAATPEQRKEWNIWSTPLRCALSHSGGLS